MLLCYCCSQAVLVLAKWLVGIMEQWRHVQQQRKLARAAARSPGSGSDGSPGGSPNRAASQWSRTVAPITDAELARSSSEGVRLLADLDVDRLDILAKEHPIAPSVLPALALMCHTVGSRSSTSHLRQLLAAPRELKARLAAVTPKSVEVMSTLEVHPHHGVGDSHCNPGECPTGQDQGHVHAALR